MAEYKIDTAVLQEIQEKINIDPCAVLKIPAEPRPVNIGDNDWKIPCSVNVTDKDRKEFFAFLKEKIETGKGEIVLTHKISFVNFGDNDGKIPCSVNVTDNDRKEFFAFLKEKIETGKGEIVHTHEISFVNFGNNDGKITCSVNVTDNDWKDFFAFLKEKIETGKGEIVLADDPSSVNVDGIDRKENSVFKKDLAFYMEEMETGYRRFVEKGKSVCNNFAIGSMAMTIQNLATIPPSSSKIKRHMMMAANGAGFLLLFCGMLQRSRGRGFGNLLILVGIILAAAGFILTMSMNLSGVTGFVIPAACMLIILAAALC